MAVDLLIKNGTVITMDASRNEIEQCDLAIHKGKIVEIKPNISIESDKVLDASGCVVCPGLINGHSHVYQSLIEGLGYDMHFNPWNWRFLFPVVSKITPKDAQASASLAALEMIKNGVTTISDHWYLHTDMENIYKVAEIFDQSGMRAQMVFGFLDETFAGVKSDSDEMTMVKSEDLLIDEARKFYGTWHGKKRTTVALGPGSTEDINESLMLKVVALSKELDVNLSTHVAGWIEINSYTIRHFGERDLEHFHSLGLTGPKGVMFHAVWLSDREIEIMARTGTKVVHCPIANAYLGYGISPVSHFLSRGISVGLGTDGAASYTYDMLEVARTAGMLQKASKLDAEAVTAEELMEMLTINGAKVLGIDDQVGSLEVGKMADVIVVDYKKPHLLPVGRWLPKLIYSARGSDVIHTVVEGKVLMESGKVLSMDEKKIIEDSLTVREDLITRAGQETRDLLSMPWPKNGPAWRSLAK
ncbi:MAG: amidohydrolase [Pelolinea sp.]|nr:amidohydrolase [Pelolinea sp.]